MDYQIIARTFQHVIQLPSLHFLDKKNKEKISKLFFPVYETYFFLVGASLLYFLVVLINL